MLRLIWLVFRKEIIETLRDKRTLIIMVLLPLALYPLIGFGLAQYMGVQYKQSHSRPSRVLIIGKKWIALEQLVDSYNKSHSTDEIIAGYMENANRQLLISKLKREEIDAALFLPKSVKKDIRNSIPLKIKILYDETIRRSQIASSRIEKTLSRLKEELVEQRLNASGLSSEIIKPIAYKTESIASSDERGSHMLARILPLLTILMVLLGAFYPAIDLTAGERERGTLEALLIAPLPRIALITGKFLVVTLVSSMTGLLNLSSMGLTLALGLDGLLEKAHVSLAIPWSSLLMSIIAIIPAAAFFSAMMIAVAALARSFKEAQNMLTPIYLVCMMPAIATQLPGIELGYGTAIVPAVNIALLTRDFIAGRMVLIPTLIAILTTIGYSLAALHFASKIYNSERLLFSTDKSLFSFRSNKSKKIQQSGEYLPSSTETLFLFLLIMSLTILLGQWLQKRNLISGLIITQYLLIALPVIALLKYSGASLKEILALHRPKLSIIATIIILAPASWYLVTFFVQHVQEAFFPMPKALAEAMQRILIARDRPIALDLFAFALSPAICEEILFRGYLRHASKPLPTAQAIFINGIVFGIFHMSIYRFFPTAMLGFLLTFIAIRSHSIYPAMLFHFINNAISIVLGRILKPSYPPGESPLDGYLWLALIAFVCGLVLLIRFTKENGVDTIVIKDAQEREANDTE